MAEVETSWTQKFYVALEPHQSGAYINFLDRNDDARILTAYGDDKYLQLAAMKYRYDRDNVFRLNHTIKPLGGVKSAASVADR